MRYNRATDRYEGDGAGLGSGWPHFMMVEWELGARVALLLDDPLQAFWELNPVDFDICWCMGACECGWDEYDPLFDQEDGMFGL